MYYNRLSESDKKQFAFLQNPNYGICIIYIDTKYDFSILKVSDCCAVKNLSFKRLKKVPWYYI